MAKKVKWQLSNRCKGFREIKSERFEIASFILDWRQFSKLKVLIVKV